MSKKLFEKVGYVTRPAEKQSNLAGEQIDVFPTYAYNVESKTAGNSAREWGEGYGAKLQYVESQNDNVPFAITIVGLEHRSEGGRAYKVVDSESRLFDLREDQVVEAFNLAGVRVGGKINGEFVWGTDGSQTKLVLVGGKLHEEMRKTLESEKAIVMKRQNGELPRESTLKVGNVYTKKDGTQHMFVGRVRVQSSKKLMFAFVEVSKPKYYDRYTVEMLEKDEYYEKHPKEKERIMWYLTVRDKWDDISPAVRCYKLGKKSSITLLASPKFVKEEVIDDEYIRNHDDAYIKVLRDNVDGEFGYKNGFGEDITSSWDLFNNVDTHRFYPDRWGVCSWDDEYKKWQDERAARYEKFAAGENRKFAKMLEWVEK